ncbi:hypothetical protein [Archangium lipolyticum]|uniref:hypothetical protein n=1 Tax=Archangium lipolyticum TaxID=2970465 RepID=UPI00214A4064|nr:hypothetical protein [Archangium lipolyticum]
MRITWSAAHPYDSGANPATAAGRVGGIDVGIEVHEGNNGSLWYRVATPQGYLEPSPGDWTSFLNWRYWSYQYDNGYKPSVAAYGDKLIEVHEDGYGGLWFHTGTFTFISGVGASATFAPSGNPLTWNYYDHGYKPSVAVYGTNLIEVHEDGNGGLWFKRGTFNSDGTVTWSPAQKYDNGFRPSVAVRDYTIVEVHEDGNGGLWLKRGSFNSDGTVSWSPAQWYDNGYKPAVTLCPYTAIVEAHEDGNGGLWSHMGNVYWSSIGWETIVKYDNGYSPSLACFPTPNYGSEQFVGADGPTLGFEVHQAGTSPGAEWYRVFNLWNWY